MLLLLYLLFHCPRLLYLFELESGSPWSLELLCAEQSVEEDGSNANDDKNVEEQPCFVKELNVSRASLMSSRAKKNFAGLKENNIDDDSKQKWLHRTLPDSGIGLIHCVGNELSNWDAESQVVKMNHDNENLLLESGVPKR